MRQKAYEMMHKFPPLTGGLPSDKRDNYFRNGLELIREHYFADVEWIAKKL